MTHELFIKRCLDLARMAYPACRPNPMVGALLVHEGQVISEGYTQSYGGPHAEVMAIRGVSDAMLRRSTLYVSLEPCAHHGKTPPCADLVAAKEIPRVVIACRDPFAQVNGRGVERLLSAGVEVIEGVLESEAIALNKRFFTYHQKQRPYVILKWAESKDGYIDSRRESGPAAKISGALMNQRVHQWRAEEQAILIGGETARRDDPRLTVRLVTGPDPERYVWTSERLADSSILQEIGYQHVEGNDAKGILAQLYAAGVQSVLVEGGRQVLQSFIDEGLYDEVRRIIGQQELGAGVKAPSMNLDKPSAVEYVDGDELQVYGYSTVARELGF